MTNHEPHASHVLVIEDDATTRELVQSALADAGYTVTVARMGPLRSRWCGSGVRCRT